MIDQFIAARKVSTPLCLIRTPDPALTVQTISAAIEDKAKELPNSNIFGTIPPMILWGCVSGWVPLNKPAKAAIAKTLGVTSADDIKAQTTNATECLERAQKLPKLAILFIQNCQQGFDNPNWIQACWDLRDLYKMDTRQLVLLTPGATLPPELAQDVMVLDEPLPTTQQLEDIVKKSFESVQREPPQEILPKAVDALCGLAAFPAEQVTAMSLVRQGEQITLNLDSLWTRKKQVIEGTPGLSVYKGSERFIDIGGLKNIKEFLLKFIKGRRPPRVVLFMDEIEKMIGGGDTDTSGTTQMQLGKFLSWTQERNPKGQVKVNGMLLLGHTGTGKSIISKACGNEAGIPTVLADLGSAKSSLVGSSEARMDQMLKVVDAIGQGEILLLATCNKVENLKPEFRSRFQLGTWMFDLPSEEERGTIWSIQRKRFDIPADDPKPEDDGWVGREIESCCQTAWLLNISLREAAAYVTISKNANAAAIALLREKANGNYISASHEGMFRHEASSTATGAARAISLD